MKHFFILTIMLRSFYFESSGSDIYLFLWNIPIIQLNIPFFQLKKVHQKSTHPKTCFPQ